MLEPRGCKSFVIVIPKLPNRLRNSSEVTSYLAAWSILPDSRSDTTIQAHSFLLFSPNTHIIATATL